MCATTAKTVRRVVEGHNAGGERPARAPRERNYASVTELVTGRVAETKGRISAKRLLPAARTAGCGGSARNFRRLVAQQKALWRRRITGVGARRCGRRVSIW